MATVVLHPCKDTALVFLLEDENPLNVNHFGLDNRLLDDIGLGYASKHTRSPCERALESFLTSAQGFIPG
jgi:hypothetical protein